MKKTIFYTFFILLLSYSYIYCQDTAITKVRVDFHVAKDWKRIDSVTYVQKNFDSTFNYYKKFLSNGHQPWRLDHANTAAACLGEFGIKYKGNVFDFASYLNVIEAYKIYSFEAGKKKYIVFIRTKDKIPIAYKLEIKKIR